MDPGYKEIAVNPRNCNLNPTRPPFALQQQRNIPEPIVKGNQNWLNYTLEEYSNSIFAHGRYNTLENLDLKIRKGLEIVDLIEVNHTSEDQDHPFGKGTHPGSLLIGLLGNFIKVPIITKPPHKHC